VDKLIQALALIEQARVLVMDIPGLRLECENVGRKFAATIGDAYLGTNLSEEEIATLHLRSNGTWERIPAIKMLRNRTGLGLKEAKDVVDNYLTENPH
jgi:ribosomal protein L7/L12